MATDVTGHDHGGRWRHCPRCGGRLAGATQCPHCDWRHFPNPPLAVVALVTTDDGSVLLVRRAAGAVAAGAWSLPGGFVDVGEHPETALARELAEETGLSVAGAHLLRADLDRTDPAKAVVALTYAVRATGAPEPGDDADAVGWFAPDDLPELAFDADRVRIEDAQSSGTSQPGVGGG